MGWLEEFGAVFRGNCWGCGLRLTANQVAGVCPSCRMDWPVIDPASGEALIRERADWEYVAAGFRVTRLHGTEQLVHRMKYGGFPRVAWSLGGWLAARWPQPPRECVLVPVPLHWRRHWKRGFNQALGLAKGLSRSWGNEVREDVLQRIAHGSSLTGASREQRQDVIYQSFVAIQCRDPVILVDDVCTMGATATTSRHVHEESACALVGGIWLGLA